MTFIIYLITIAISIPIGGLSTWILLPIMKKPNAPHKSIALIAGFLDGLIAILVASFILYVLNITPNVWLFILLMIAYSYNYLKRTSISLKKEANPDYYPNQKIATQLITINSIGDTIGLIIGAFLIYQ